jgi:hypothetical protein
VNFDTDRETDLDICLDRSCLCIDCEARGGVKGDELVDMLVAILVVLACGEGVSGIRPPAVFEEKRP